ncbi:MAG TPA: peptidylprolyl isomerase [Candidatus Fimadaptatus faecigallinarum]|uniref:Peptidylprolyl isomerase n=1 Tax=Candidatus Fimadaptatus faecigallinarum TaxID=2840814 RepID=A0A9D1LSX3_9FIRM|nr:peptidylprolyl isomerase [Candidatus Fimadaptatus faecigallinarum]
MRSNTMARLLALVLAALMLVGTAGALADSADGDAAVTAAPDAQTTVESTATPDAQTTAESTAEPTAEPSAAPTADTRPAVDSSVVVTIGDVNVTADEVAELYSYVLDMYSYYGYDTTDPEVLSMLQDVTLDAAIMSKVEQLMEAERGLDVFTDEELAEFRTQAQATYDEAYADLYDSLNDGEMTEDELNAQTLAQLESYGYTVDALVEQAKSEAAYNKLYAELTQDVQVTDEDVAEYYAQIVENDKQIYENDLASYTLQSMYGSRPSYTPAGIRTVKHILIKYLDEDAQKISELVAMSEKPDDYEEQYEALKQAAYANIKDTVDEIMARIAEGEDFDALVEEYGEDPGMQSEPYKSEGYMVYDGATTLVAEFVDSAMALENVGDVTTEPVLTEYGAHIMLYYSDLEPGEVELTDEKAETLRAELLAERQDEAYNDALNAYQAELGQVYRYPENLVRADLTAEQEAVEESIIADESVIIDGDAAESDADAAQSDADAPAATENVPDATEPAATAETDLSEGA